MNKADKCSEGFTDAWKCVGATLCKGLNRGLGTLLAGSLAFFIEYIATESGHVFRAIFIGAAVFMIGKLMLTFLMLNKNQDFQCNFKIIIF